MFAPNQRYTATTYAATAALLEGASTFRTSIVSAMVPMEGGVITQWEDTRYSNSLVRSGDGAGLESFRLDGIEAPHKAIDLKKMQEEQSRE